MDEPTRYCRKCFDARRDSVEAVYYAFTESGRCAGCYIVVPPRLSVGAIPLRKTPLSALRDFLGRLFA